MERITESSSNYNDLEKMTVFELLQNINREDHKVAQAVRECIPEIEAFVTACAKKMCKGGRLFYMGAGTSGRLGVVDASECPPTFGVSENVIVGLIAGGDQAIRRAVEFAEDDKKQGWNDLMDAEITDLDTVVGIAASGTTPYVIGALRACKDHNILTAGITCNPESPLSIVPDHPIVPVVGPEFVTGSTRMKSGTAQKLVLNMISTSLMIQLGHVKGNKMVDMQLSNDKLLDRGAKMVQSGLECTYEEAEALLKKYGSVRKAIDSKV
ncbi:MAG: N-acetylmuramic acid 6-phosphate etherase [Crocinitomicaceae bacterium]|nr:N-acetylmuramic acid 6-phosphate etherase [Crocinitomicaceae bacterium]